MHTMQSSHCPSSTADVPTQPKPCAAVPMALESAAQLRVSLLFHPLHQAPGCNVLPPPRFQCPNLSSQPPHPPRGSQPPQPRHSPLHAPGLLSLLSSKVADALSRDPLCVVPGLVSHGSRFAPHPVYPRSTCSRHHRPASAFPREWRRARPRGEAWPDGGRIQSARGGEW